MGPRHPMGPPQLLKRNDPRCSLSARCVLGASSSLSLCGGTRTLSEWLVALPGLPEQCLPGGDSCIHPSVLQMVLFYWKL